MNEERVILIVDDEEDIQELLEIPFLGSNHITLKASSGDEAFGFIVNEFVDVVITDIQMPSGTGTELINKINELPFNDRPIVFVITGEDDLSIEDAKELGVSKYYRKPFSIKEIVNDVKCSVEEFLYYFPYQSLSEH